METQTVIVASTNPVKIQAARAGFAIMYPQARFEFRGVSVESGVSHQPFSDSETLQGALNRARNAHDLTLNAHYYVGIEGGVEPLGTELFASAWVVIMTPDGRTGKARSGAFALPHEVAVLVRSGMELGHADDQVFNRQGSKRETGSIGILTDNVMTRTDFYTPAVIMALIPFKNPTLTFGG